jgi:DNA-binding transcriptional MerR regulator
MSKVTISEAARLAGISRTQLYRGFINKGKISVTKDNEKVSIDLSELLRVFPDIKHDTADTLHNVAESNTQNTHEQTEVVTLLREQLQRAEQQLQEAKDREEWFRQQIDELRQQQSNLLENKLETSKPKRKKFLGIF